MEWQLKASSMLIELNRLVKILESVVDNSVEEFTFRKSHWGCNNVIQISWNHRMSITVNPQLIFQWLVLMGERCRELSSLFKNELYCFPSALFESSFHPLQPNKPVLANALWKSIHESQQEPSKDVQYVLDGGTLLHCLPWPLAVDPYMMMCVKCMLIMWNKDMALLFLFLMDTPMNLQQKMLYIW